MLALSLVTIVSLSIDSLLIHSKRIVLISGTRWHMGLRPETPEDESQNHDRHVTITLTLTIKRLRKYFRLSSFKKKSKSFILSLKI